MHRVIDSANHDELRPDMDLIAKKAGVSKTTVHRALHDTGRISSNTRSRILRIADEIGYQPNLVASSLRSSRTATLGLVVPGISGNLYSRILEGMEAVAQAKGYRVFLCNTRGDFEREKEIIETLLSSRVDGIAVAPSPNAESAAFYRNLSRSKTPVVLIDRGILGFEGDLVTTDHEEGGFQLGRHMISLGHRRHAFLSLPLSGRLDSVSGRIAGYNRSLFDAGLPALDLFEAGLLDSAQLRPDETECDLTEICRRAVRNFLIPQLERRPFDALFAEYDHMAIATISVLREQGLRVPDDLAVVGFDDQDFTEYCQPPLTTVRQPLLDIGRHAIDQLLGRIQGNDAPPQTLRLPPLLQVRSSCGSRPRN